MLTSTAAPGWLRRFSSLIYDGVLLLALLMLATLIYLIVFDDATATPERYFFQLYLWLVCGVYFVWNWTRGGQTLAMQTWRIRLMTRDGGPLTTDQAIKRYVLASIFFGLAFIWAIFDREGLYLHDRLSGTRLALLDKKLKAS